MQTRKQRQAALRSVGAIDSDDDDVADSGSDYAGGDSSDEDVASTDGASVGRG